MLIVSLRLCASGRKIIITTLLRTAAILVSNETPICSQLSVVRRRYNIVEICSVSPRQNYTGTNLQSVPEYHIFLLSRSL